MANKEFIKVWSISVPGEAEIFLTISYPVASMIMYKWKCLEWKRRQWEVLPLRSFNKLDFVDKVDSYLW